MDDFRGRMRTVTIVLCAAANMSLIDNLVEVEVQQGIPVVETRN